MNVLCNTCKRGMDLIEKTQLPSAVSVAEAKADPDAVTFPGYTRSQYRCGGCGADIRIFRQGTRKEETP